LATDSYDANGNTTSSDGHAFAYDFENRLRSKDSGAVTIVYDGDGNRVAKTVGGVTTKYLVDDLNPTGYLQVLEEVGSSGIETRYTYGTLLVSQTRQPGLSEQISYYGYDARGSVAFLTDSVGDVTDSYEYDAFGNIVLRSGASPNTRLYLGEELDPDLGTINFRARQYQASVGRFLTIDSVLGKTQNPPSWNRYLYAAADAVNRIDRNGTVEAIEGFSFEEGGVKAAEIQAENAAEFARREQTYVAYIGDADEVPIAEKFSPPRGGTLADCFRKLKGTKGIGPRAALVALCLLLVWSSPS
jgi:RHS repeat-associated protein